MIILAMTMMTTKYDLPAVVISLESAGTELRLDVHGRFFAIPVADGIVQRRDVIDAAYDARLTMTNLGALYRAVEGMDIQFDGPDTPPASDLVFPVSSIRRDNLVGICIEVLTITHVLIEYICNNVSYFSHFSGHHK